MEREELLDKLDELKHIKSVEVTEVKQGAETILKARVHFDKLTSITMTIESNGDISKTRKRMYDIIAQHDRDEWVL